MAATKHTLLAIKCISGISCDFISQWSESGT